MRKHEKYIYIVALIGLLIAVGAWVYQNQKLVDTQTTVEPVVKSEVTMESTALIEESCADWDFAERTVHIADKEITVALANTVPERQRGLGGCERIPDNTGMYFILDGAGAPVFWMKDTVIPIDIVWIYKGRVVGIEDNVQPEPGVPDGELTLYKPSSRADVVLELAAGKAKELGITEGATAEILN